MAYDRWSRIYPDIQAVQAESETNFSEMIKAIDETASRLAEDNPELTRAFLTNFSCSSGDALFERWQDLAGAIITKHVDGYVNDLKSPPKGVNYPEDWLRKVLEESADQLRLPVENDS